MTHVTSQPGLRDSPADNKAQHLWYRQQRQPGSCSTENLCQPQTKVTWALLFHPVLFPRYFSCAPSPPAQHGHPAAVSKTRAGKQAQQLPPLHHPPGSQSSCCPQFPFVTWASQRSCGVLAALWREPWMEPTPHGKPVQGHTDCSANASSSTEKCCILSRRHAARYLCLKKTTTANCYSQATRQQSQAAGPM